MTLYDKLKNLNQSQKIEIGKILFPNTEVVLMETNPQRNPSEIFSFYVKPNYYKCYVDARPDGYFQVSNMLRRGHITDYDNTENLTKLSNYIDSLSYD